MSSDVEGLIPASLLNDLVYCPRRFWYAAVLGEESLNLPLAQGRTAHEALDAPRLAGRRRREEETIRTRAVDLASPTLGLVGKADLVEEDGDEAIPVEHKRGRGRDPAWENDQVQVGALILMLREAGYRSDRGAIFYRGSRKRVDVPMTPELEAAVRAAVAQARAIITPGASPAPIIEDRQRCSGCRFLGVCLPDEEAYVHRLGDAEPAGSDDQADGVARVVAGKSSGEVLFLDRQGLRVRVRGEALQLEAEGESLTHQPLNVLDSIVVAGMVDISAPAISKLLLQGTPVSFLGVRGRYKGALLPACSRNGILRQRQAIASVDSQLRLTIARDMVCGKISNQRTVLLRANRRHDDERLPRVANRLRQFMDGIGSAGDLDAIRGVEGAAARVYFAAFGEILGSQRSDPSMRFDRRSRRPPRDGTNALLSFMYALLTADVTATVHAVGLDPYIGFLHGQRYGQPALALDLVEEMRPAIAESLVLRLVNNGEIGKSDLVEAPTAVLLNEQGRKKVYAAYAERMGQEVVHPVFGYSVTWRRVLEVQARMLAKFLLGESPRYVPFATR